MKTSTTHSKGTVWGIIPMLLLGALGCRANASGNLLTHDLVQPLNGVTSASVEIDSGSGNMTIDQLAGGEQMLASGTLQYYESQGLPTQTLTVNDGQATFTLRGGKVTQSGLRLPWEACNWETNWQVHLNPGVPSAIKAHSDGGNIKLNLAEMAVSSLSADTGGGNVDVILPANAASLSVTAKTGAGNVNVEMGKGITGSSVISASSGAGNVVVSVPDGVAARVHATSGMGKTNVDARFSKVDANTYQSPDYESATDKVEITLSSGAGNVSVK